MKISFVGQHMAFCIKSYLLAGVSIRKLAIRT